MQTKYSIPGAPLISPVGFSKTRTSRVRGANIITASNNNPFASEHQGTYGVGYRGTYIAPNTPLSGANKIRTSTVIATGGLPVHATKGSFVVKPTGSQIIRVQRPTEYVHHAPTPYMENQTNTRVSYQSDYPSQRRMQRKSRLSNCPWWLWLVLGLIGLALIAGIIFGCFRHFAAKNKQKIDQNKIKIDTYKKSQQVEKFNKQIKRNPTKNINYGIRNTNINSNRFIANQEQQARSKPTFVYKNSTDIKEKDVTKLCETGFFAFNGKCIKCPEGAYWNGANCVVKTSTKKPLNQLKPINSRVERQFQYKDSQQQQEGYKQQEPEDIEKQIPNTQKIQPSSIPLQKQRLQNQENTMGQYQPQPNVDNLQNISKNTNNKGVIQSNNRNQASNAFEGIKEGLSSVANTTSNVFSNLWSGVKFLGKKAIDTFTDVTSIPKKEASVNAPNDIGTRDASKVQNTGIWDSIIRHNTNV